MSVFSFCVLCLQLQMPSVNIFLNLFTAKATSCSLPSFYIFTLFYTITEEFVNQTTNELLLYRGHSLVANIFSDWKVSPSTKSWFVQRCLQCLMVADKKGTCSQTRRRKTSIFYYLKVMGKLDRKFWWGSGKIYTNIMLQFSSAPDQGQERQSLLLLQTSTGTKKHYGKGRILSW